MADLMQLVFIDRPNLIFPALSASLAFLALSPTPSFIPLTLLVATLLVYTRISFCRPRAPRAILGTFFVISLASTFSHIIPSIHALSSAPLSVISLWMMSSLSSSIAFSVILLDRLSVRLNLPWAEVALFPAMWTFTWQLISHASPVGHLITWSPVTGITSYEWMRPLFGTWGINWIVGAYATVIAELVGVWFIGPVEDPEPHGPLIPSIVSGADPQQSKPTSLRRAHRSSLLGATLLALTLPSFLFPTVPNLPWSTSSTPLPVSCILPHPPLTGDGSSPLDTFIAESKQHNGARLLLWPEGALRFETAAQREEALNRVQSEIQGPLVGVTFTEPVPPSAGWTHAREGTWRNGLVLVGPNGPVAEFYKRNLVPSTSSSIMAPPAALTQPPQSQNPTPSPNSRSALSFTSSRFTEPTRTRSGLRPLRTIAPFPSVLPFAWISPARPSLPPWIRARHLSWRLLGPGTVTSVWQCGSKPERVLRKPEVWCCSVMVAPKARVEWLVMAYESLSNSDPGRGRASSVLHGHSTSIALFTCWEVNPSNLPLCGCSWAQAVPLRLLSCVEHSVALWWSVALVGPLFHFPA
jgi:hypothetical protein